VPFQFNFNNGGGLSDQTYFNLNIQPVIPIHLTQDWSLIARTIVPGYSPASGRRSVARVKLRRLVTLRNLGGQAPQSPKPRRGGGDTAELLMPRYYTCLLYHLAFSTKDQPQPHHETATSHLERTMPLRICFSPSERTTLAVEDARSLLTRLMPFVEGGWNQS
jgi:hypothetical protein